VFTAAGQMRPSDVQVREYKVMSMLRHENIVKLLAIEEEVNKILSSYWLLKKR
jgi:hypothetical protein